MITRYIAEERWVADGRLLLAAEFDTPELANDFWKRRMSGAVPAGTYAPHAPRRLVLKTVKS